MTAAPRCPTPPVEVLRAERLALRGELTEVGHWRRLLRAKIDLTVARGAGPDPLRPTHPTIAPCVPDDLVLDLDLARLCQVPAEGFPMGSLVSLRTADTRLERYEVALRRALMAVTDRLVGRLATSSDVPGGRELSAGTERGGTGVRSGDVPATDVGMGHT